MDEIEKKFLELVKEQFKKSGGSNGLDLFGVNEKLNISVHELREIVDKLMQERKVVYLNHLNGRSITLPK